MMSTDKFIIEQLFNELFAHFPAWRQYFSDASQADNIMSVWMEAIMDAGINDPETLAQGIKRASKTFSSAFIPSPEQFVRCCRPTAEELGIPDHAKALSQSLACGLSDKAWGRHHPFLFYFWERMGEGDRYSILKMQNDQAMRMTKPAYERLVDDIVSGKIDINAPLKKKLPATINGKIKAPEAAKPHLEALSDLISAPEDDGWKQRAINSLKKAG